MQVASFEEVDGEPTESLCIQIVAAAELAASIGERAVEAASGFTAPVVPDEEVAVSVVSGALLPLEVGDRALQPAEPRGAGAVRGGIFECGARGASRECRHLIALTAVAQASLAVVLQRRSMWRVTPAKASPET
jgi:hypothetical protein